MPKGYCGETSLKNIFLNLCNNPANASVKKTAMQSIQLSIPEPCQQNWGNMQPNNEGRFCNFCAKTVVDFTDMSDEELLAYFAKPATGSICGRVNNIQLERVLQAPAKPRKRIFLYWQYALTLLLFFTRSNTSKAQGEMNLQVSNINKPAAKPAAFLKGKLIAAEKNPAQSILMGDTVYNPGIAAIKPALRVTNASGEAIPFASITLLPGNKTFIADYEGTVTSLPLQPHQEIMVTAVGYETVTSTAADIEANTIVLPLKPVLLDNLVIESSQTVGRLRMGALVCQVSVYRNFQDSITNLFARFSSALTIYPNPVQKAAGFTVNFNAQANGLYHVRVSAVNGQVLMQQSITAAGNKTSLPMQVPANWSNGVYLITLSDAKNKIIGTSKFIVQ